MRLAIEIKIMRVYNAWNDTHTESVVIYLIYLGAINYDTYNARSIKTSLTCVRNY